MESTAGYQYSYTYRNLQKPIAKICSIVSGSGHSMLVQEYLEMDDYGLLLIVNSVWPYNRNICCFLL
jgi:hypothetical protein